MLERLENRMTIRAVRVCVFLWFLITLVGAAQVRELPSATDAHGGFGLPDQRGRRLLIVTSQSDRSRALARPELLKTALCGGGRRVAVQFERRQVESANDGRQTSRSFDKLPGSVYAIAGTTIDSDVPCFLASDALLTGSTVLSIAAAGGSGACSQRSRFATLRD